VLQQVAKTNLGISTSELVDQVGGGNDLAALTTISDILDGVSPYDPKAFTAGGHIFYTLAVFVPPIEPAPIFPGIYSSNVAESGMWICTGSLDSWRNAVGKDYEECFELTIASIRSALRNHGLHKLFRPK